MPERVLRIVNSRGLHARASARFADEAAHHDATVSVHLDGEEAAGDSILDLLTLAAAKGADITVRAEGTEAEAALDGLEALVKSRFGEES